jgi:predicted NBD/HSP70 family sugar kinase/transcriptional regulator with XRE-family HTH domain
LNLKPEIWNLKLFLDMPTLRDVATLAGVSVTTVSNVVNDARRVLPATRARVEGAMAQLNYAPARGALSAESLSGSSHTATSSLTPDTPDRSATDDAFPARPYAVAAAADPGTPARAARLLLRLLRAAQPISRVELARRLGVNRSTVTDIFKPLIASGLVREESGSSADRVLGRPPVALSFNGDHDFFAGINIGIRRVQVGLGTLGGEIVSEDGFDTPADPTETLALVRERITRLCAGDEQRTLRMIGVSVSGMTDAGRTRVVYAPHLAWHDVAVAEALRFNAAGEVAAPDEETVPVVVENDATAAAIYEARLRLRDTDVNQMENFVLVRSGTGIGVGLVLGGEVYRGAGRGEGLAGEFGHMTIVAGGKSCVCGNRGCWERYASASSAASLYAGDRLQMNGAARPRYVEIVARAEAGEVRARRTLERVGEYLGIGIGNVIMGLGVPRVILSGRVVLGWKFMQEPLRNAVGQSMAGRAGGWSVEPGEPRGAGLGGALEVAAEGFLTSGFYV